MSGKVPVRYSPKFGTRLVSKEVDGQTVSGVESNLFVPDATRVEFCMLDEAGGGFAQRNFDMEPSGYGVWSVFVEGVRSGQRYGFRVHGPWDPENGHFFNPAKLLVDPYARSVVGEFTLREEVFAHKVLRVLPHDWERVLHDGKLQINEYDSAPFVPHSVVVSESEEAACHPDVAWRDTVIYETHVRGLTAQAPWLPEELRGTYAGLGHPKTVEYLKSLGVTSIELLPIHSSVSEMHLLEHGLKNYWGYSNLSYFAPNPSYATAAAREAGGEAVNNELKAAVKALHDAGLEVILDVVYNHTCEEGNNGPCLSYRGIANQNYYCHPEGKPGELYDTTGCGNSLNFREPHVVKLALDSLKYWATEYGVDGFRFDLMATLGRGPNGFSKEHPFFVQLKNDEVLGNLKVIAEPWDLGENGWQTGNFGFPFSEWNDSFRNAARSFWVADYGRMLQNYAVSSPQNLATRLAGSRDVFGADPCEKMRGPLASINFITAHDGFTLRDLVSYNTKHNEANREGNRDGTQDNNSYNFGIEGAAQSERRAKTTSKSEDKPTTPETKKLEEQAAEIEKLRLQAQRNALGTLFCSSGVPMLLGGDEFGRTQHGNNNAYCQDNAISYYDWKFKPWQEELLETTKQLIELRKSLPALRQNHFFSGRKLHDTDILPDLSWWRPTGEEFTSEAWENSAHRCFQCLFARPEENERDVLIVVNGRAEEVPITLPGVQNSDGEPISLQFELLWNSAVASRQDPVRITESTELAAEPFSMLLLASV